MTGCTNVWFVLGHTIVLLSLANCDNACPRTRPHNILNVFIYDKFKYIVTICPKTWPLGSIMGRLCSFNGSPVTLQAIKHFVHFAFRLIFAYIIIITCK